MVLKHTDPALFVYVCMGVCTYVQKQVNAHTHTCVERYRQLQTLKLLLYMHTMCAYKYLYILYSLIQEGDALQKFLCGLVILHQSDCVGFKLKIKGRLSCGFSVQHVHSACGNHQKGTSPRSHLRADI